MYSFCMSNFEIVQSSYHENKLGEPFIVAIVDDADYDDTKLVIMFGDEGYTAVLSLDALIDEDDISARTNSWNVSKFEKLLRHPLWEDDDADEEYEVF